MIALTDKKLEIVMAAATPLPPEKRAILLERIAAHLQLYGGRAGRGFGDADVEHALAVLRSEKPMLKDHARVNAETAARNEENHKKNSEGWRRENLKLQEQLLAAQERVYQLQDKLLSLRQIVNGA